MPKNTSTPPNGSASRDRKLAQAERKAAKLLDDARREAARIRGEAKADAARTRAEADEHARRVVLDARASADGVRAEGMELVSSLRQIGDALRAGSDQVLHDIETVHARMVGELEHVQPEGAAGAPGPAGPVPPSVTERGDSLEVPDFVARRD